MMQIPYPQSICKKSMLSGLIYEGFEPIGEGVFKKMKNR